jgi:hypothetical protein
MVAARRAEPEWLDDLAVDDPRAIHSRRDLRWLNAWMGQDRIMAAFLRETASDRRPMSLLEIGAGDGAFMLAVRRRLGRRFSPATITLLDRQPVATRAVGEAYLQLGWRTRAVTSDVFEFLSGGDDLGFDVITANLFLHHFDDERLARLLQLAAGRCDLFIACEPNRSALALATCRLLWAIGCNDVTRHDALASVRAGFANQELSALWPTQQGWSLLEKPRGLFTQTFVARRIP